MVNYLESIPNHKWYMNYCIPITAINMTFSVTYYLELCDALHIYCIPHILPEDVRLIVRTLRRLTTLLDKTLH